MKKLFFLPVVVLVFLIVLSCYQDSTPDQLLEKEQDWGSKANLVLSGIEDNVFSTSLRREALLIGDSMNKGRTIYATLLCLSSDNQFFELPVLEGYHPLSMNNTWRSMIASQVICAAAESNYIRNIHKSGNTIKIVGSMVTWKTSRFFSGDNTYGVIDYNGDGEWDFVAEKDFSQYVFVGSSTAYGYDKIISYQEGLDLYIQTDISKKYVKGEVTLEALELLI